MFNSTNKKIFNYQIPEKNIVYNKNALRNENRTFVLTQIRLLVALVNWLSKNQSSSHWRKHMFYRIVDFQNNYIF